MLLLKPRRCVGVLPQPSVALCPLALRLCIMLYVTVDLMCINTWRLCFDFRSIMRCGQVELCP